jgi:hypothetical protein
MKVKTVGSVDGDCPLWFSHQIGTPVSKDSEDQMTYSNVTNYWAEVNTHAGVGSLSASDVSQVFHPFTLQVILHGLNINDIKQPGVTFTGRCLELANINTHQSPIKTFICRFDFQGTRMIRSLVVTVKMDLTTQQVSAVPLVGWDVRGLSISDALDMRTGMEIYGSYGNIKACADWLMSAAA